MTDEIFLVDEKKFLRTCQTFFVYPAKNYKQGEALKFSFLIFLSNAKELKNLVSLVKSLMFEACLAFFTYPSSSSC